MIRPREVNNEQNYTLSTLFNQDCCYDIAMEIFFHATLKDLGTSFALINKRCNKVTNEPFVLKKVIYNHVTFNPRDWVVQYGDAFLNVDDEEKAFKTLPNDIAKILKNPCPLFKDQIFLNTHLIVWIPKGLSIKHYLFLLNQKCPNQIYYTCASIMKKFGAEVTLTSEWVILQKRAIPSIRQKNNVEKQEFVARLDLLNFKSCEISLTLEIIICFTTTFFKRFKDHSNLQKRVTEFNFELLHSVVSKNSTVNCILLLFKTGLHLDWRNPEVECHGCGIVTSRRFLEQKTIA